MIIKESLDCDFAQAKVGFYELGIHKKPKNHAREQRSAPSAILVTVSIICFFMNNKKPGCLLFADVRGKYAAGL